MGKVKHGKGRKLDEHGKSPVFASVVDKLASLCLHYFTLKIGHCSLFVLPNKILKLKSQYASVCESSLENAIYIYILLVVNSCFTFFIFWVKFTKTHN